VRSKANIGFTHGLQLASACIAATAAEDDGVAPTAADTGAAWPTAAATAATGEAAAAVAAAAVAECAASNGRRECSRSVMRAG
jgi:hypothetical protein